MCEGQERGGRCLDRPPMPAVLSTHAGVTWRRKQATSSCYYQDSCDLLDRLAGLEKPRGTCFVDHGSSATTSCVLLGPPVTMSSRVPPQATAAGSACAPGKADPWLGRLHPGQPLPPPRTSCHHYRALGRGDMLVVFRQGHWLGSRQPGADCGLLSFLVTL